MSDKNVIIECAECGADILNDFELLEGLKSRTHIIVPKADLDVFQGYIITLIQIAKHGLKQNRDNMLPEELEAHKAGIKVHEEQLAKLKAMIKG